MPVSQIKMHLGAMSKHNMYEAEIVGVILAIWLLSSCLDTVGKTVSLYINNQAVITTINALKATSGQYLIRHLNLLANNLTCRLGFHWISSHSNIKGNEKVDELAKDAAKGRLSARARLPHLLQARLPVSASAIKQEFHGKLKEKWEDLWEKSERSQSMAVIDDNFPFNGFHKCTYQLSRYQASLMAQIRCGHIPLNMYLARIGKSDTEMCQACIEQAEGMHQCKTVKHFIFECPSFMQKRNELIAKIGIRHLNLSNIMTNTDYMRELAAYISRTGQLKRQ